MKVPKKRRYTRIGTIQASEGTFSKYISIEQSVADFIYWLEDFKAPPEFFNVDGYCSWLKSKGYYEDSVTNYTNALAKWI